MGNKIFVIGREYTFSCEVFDSFSRKYTLIEAQLTNCDVYWSIIYKAVSIGDAIFVIRSYKDSTMYTYDTQKSQWSIKDCSILKSLTNKAFVKFYTD